MDDDDAGTVGHSGPRTADVNEFDHLSLSRVLTLVDHRYVRGVSETPGVSSVAAASVS